MMVSTVSQPRLGFGSAVGDWLCKYAVSVKTENTKIRGRFIGLLAMRWKWDNDTADKVKKTELEFNDAGLCRR
jgi:hypothetical protein